MKRWRVRFKPNLWVNFFMVGAYPLMFAVASWRRAPLEVFLIALVALIPGLATIAFSSELSARTIVVDDSQLMILTGPRRTTLARFEFAEIRDVITTGGNAVVLTLNNGGTVSVLTGMNKGEAQAACDAIRSACSRH